MTTVEQIAERVERLPAFRQREVLDFLAFIEIQDAGEDMGAEWNRELDLRIRYIEAGRAKGFAAEAVVREMRAKYG